ncbi:hypothetical protein AB0N17_12315 [Streptomyces sp. NPDC051133]
MRIRASATGETAASTCVGTVKIGWTPPYFQRATDDLVDVK